MTAIFEDTEASKDRDDGLRVGRFQGLFRKYHAGREIDLLYEDGLVPGAHSDPAEYAEFSNDGIAPIDGVDQSFFERLDVNIEVNTDTLESPAPSDEGGSQRNLDELDSDDEERSDHSSDDHRSSHHSDEEDAPGQFRADDQFQSFDPPDDASTNSLIDEDPYQPHDDAEPYDQTDLAEHVEEGQGGADRQSEDGSDTDGFLLDLPPDPPTSQAARPASAAPDHPTLNDVPSASVRASSGQDDDMDMYLRDLATPSTSQAAQSDWDEPESVEVGLHDYPDEEGPFRGRKRPRSDEEEI